MSVAKRIGFEVVVVSVTMFVPDLVVRVMVRIVNPVPIMMMCFFLTL
jgi:hypothetical protein